MIRDISPKQSFPSADNVFNDDFEITTIDWEKSGLHPSYWEYCIALWALRWDDD
jgi:hypothetical protein